MERGQQLGQDRQGAAADHAHPDLAADQPGQLIHGQPGAGHGVQGGPGERQHGRAHLGQPDRPGGAVKQPVAELGLQPPDLRAHPGLGHVYPVGRPGEAGLLGHGHEVLELMQFHNR